MVKERMTEGMKKRCEKIKELYESGLCIYDIAVQFDYQPGTVEGILFMQGINPNDKRSVRAEIRKPRIFPVMVDGKQYWDYTEVFLAN